MFSYAEHVNGIAVVCVIVDTFAYPLDYVPPDVNITLPAAVVVRAQTPCGVERILDTVTLSVLPYVTTSRKEVNYVFIRCRCFSSDGGVRSNT